MATAPNPEHVHLAEDALHQGLRGELLQRRARLTEALERQQSAQITQLLDEVDAALERFDAGSFGICELCHEAVETDRLIADPLVRFCIDHLPPEQRRALEADLELAAQAQARLLPKRDLQIDGWRMAYHYQPAGIVSGDYIDVIEAPDRSVFFALGDVSGKGVASSMLMANLSALFRALVPIEVPLARLMHQANRIFCESTLPSHYATLVCGRARPNGDVEFVNAGHLEPLVRTSGRIVRVESGSLPIGMFCDQEFTSTTVTLSSGDGILLYTDGISETRDGGNTEYGAAGLEQVIQRRTAFDAPDAVAACVADVNSFRGAAAPEDDQTLMVIQRV